MVISVSDGIQNAMIYDLFFYFCPSKDLKGQIAENMDQPSSIASVIIASSQFLVSEGLKSLLKDESQLRVAIVVNSREEMCQALEDHECRLLIVDHAIFEWGGSNEIIAIQEKVPGILLISDNLNKAEFSDLTKNGVKNIIYKTADKDEILNAIEATLKGKKYFSGEILDMLTEPVETRLLAEEPAHLTWSEIEIVRLIASGLTTKEIARRKNISFHTVNTHRKNIFRKMHVSNASELIMQAIKSGWIDNIEYYI